MSLIDTSYFVGDLDIAGLSSQNVRARVEAFIDKWEPKFLAAVLGPLYADYAAGLTADPVESFWPVISQKLKNAIACYVYYWYTRDAVTKTTRQGEAKPEGQAQAAVSSVHKQARAWNEMREDVMSLYEYLDTNNSSYSSWDSSYRYGFTSGGRFVRNEFVRPINAMNL